MCAWSRLMNLGPVFIAISGALLVYRLWIYVRHPLRRFPGPSLASWTNAPYSYWFLRGRQPFVMLEIHKKYGSVVRVAPNELSFDTATSWKDIYAARSGHEPFIKSDFYDGGSFHQEAHSIVTERDPKAHALMRKQLAPAFSERALREQAPLIGTIIDEFICQIGAHGDCEAGIDLTHWMTMCMFDITGSLAFGQDFGALKNGGKHPSVMFIQKALRQVAVLDTFRRFPALQSTSKFLFRSQIKSLLHDNEMHENNCMNLIKRRRMNLTQQSDFLSHIVQNSGTYDISDVQLAAHAADLLQAGTDTSNTTLCTAIYHMLRDARVMASVKEEVMSKFNTYEEITAALANNMPYMKAVLKESMRIYPPLPLGVPRVVPAGGDNIDGHYVPGGTIVSTNPLATCWSPENFTSPQNFVPERWLKSDHVDILEASQPFSVGPRNCIGQNLAWMEMTTIMAKLVFKYDFTLVDEDLDWYGRSKMSLQWVKPPLLVRVVPSNKE